MDAKRLLGVALAILVIGGVIWLKLSDRADDSQAVRSDIMAALAEIDGYAEHEQFLLQRADLAHERAFGEAYNVGGRRRAAQFDERQYVQVFFHDLIQAAQQARKPTLVTSLEQMKAQLLGGI